MPATEVTTQDVTLRIKVLDGAGNFLGGKVDIEFKHRTLGESAAQKGLDASREIAVSGLRRAPQGAYQVTVTPSDRFDPQSQFINIPASGAATMEFNFRKQSSDPVQPPVPQPPAPPAPGPAPVLDNQDVVLRIRVLNSQGSFLGGKVDLEFKHRTLTESATQQGVDASQEISVTGLRRAPVGDYQVTVTPSDRFDPQSQFVNIPASGVANMEFVFSSQGSVPPGDGGNQFQVTGRLFLDYGLPANGVTVRLYSRGFAGADTRLAESKTRDNGAYAISYAAPASGANIELRVVDSQGKETPVSHTKFEADKTEILNLVAPASVQPLAPEFQRLAADMDKHIDGIEKLAQAQETGDRQDLKLVTKSTGWDARLLALAATAAQQTAVTGLGQDVLYALYRVGLPTDAQHLALVSSDTVKSALDKAGKAGIIGMNDQQVTDATAAFQKFATGTRLGLKSPGSVSNFGDLLPASLFETPKQRDDFANLYFSRPTAGADLWQDAANNKIPPKAIDSLKLQGKFLYLTLNNAALSTNLLQQIDSLDKLHELADKDFYKSDAWKKSLTDLAGDGGNDALDKLVPQSYPGKDATERLEPYAADLARKVRFSFPTQVTARMIDNKELSVDPASAGNVSAFLRSAAPLGFELGRTPINHFLKTQSSGLPELDTASTRSLKTLQRLYQVTPSTESLNVVLTLGFTSAYEIASYRKEEFMNKYGDAFPSPAEASLVYGRAQQIKSVTFNFFSIAQQVDTQPPMYGLSGSAEDRQNARNAIVKQFPSMASLFGSLDYCQCEDCRSVLSPAAYLVDLLNFLDSSPTNPNAPISYPVAPTGTKDLTPLDVLIGNKDAGVSGRRPDLAALPLTCENTNTAMPYIDLVNEILEYYIAHNKLDAQAAYDTGEATTADLTAEPQHIVPDVYDSNLKQALYPLNLPFDLWTETVRGFLNYYNVPLTKVLEVMRLAADLELFTDGNNYPYYRAQIFAESLGISPVEYGVFTVTDPGAAPSVQKWFRLYGYADDGQGENTALNGKPDPDNLADYLVPPLKSAKNLAQRLGLTYQELTDLVSTGFFNPALNALVFQFKRFGISLSDAFSYAAGAPPANFQSLLDGITARYKKQNPAFDAGIWLNSVLPAGSSQKVLVLKDPDTGCNFSGTLLQYADGSAATPLDFLKLNLFVRLWKKLGWTMDETDRALQLFFLSGLPPWSNAGFARAFSDRWKTALIYLAHLNHLAARLNPSAGRAGLLPLWSDLPVQGTAPLYAQLFLTPSVLNNDVQFDDPAGRFPSATADPFANHQAAVQGVLGLTSDEVAAIFKDQNIASPTFTLANLSLCYRYSMLAKCLELPVTDLVALKTMSGIDPFSPPVAGILAQLADDRLWKGTLAFVKQVAAVKASGFTVEDLKYLLRHQFDPVGKYQSDPNARMALVQLVAGGLLQIGIQNAVPSGLEGLSEDLIEQKLSGLFPASLLKALFAQLTGTFGYAASQGGIASGVQIDPAPFAAETRLTFGYDSTTNVQTVTYKGVLLDWKKNDLLQINHSPLFTSLLNSVQQQTQIAFNRSLGDVLGVWASMVEYQAAPVAAAAALAAGPLVQQDPALSLSYYQADGKQWLAYRGVLTDTKKTALTSIDGSATLLSLLNDVQQQAIPAYRELIGTLLAMWAYGQSYKATQAGVLPGSEINPASLAGYPAIRVSYDAAAQIQTLTHQGVLTDAKRIELAVLVPAAAGLLLAVRNAAVQFFQAQAAGLLTVTPADLDTFVQPFIGSDIAKMQKRAKAELVKVFLPLLANKLSRQFVAQTLASDLGSDPGLTQTLATDPGLLPDPGNPGQSLMATCLALGSEGASVSYYASADGSGPALATSTASVVDTNDSTNPNAGNAGTGSARFEGYLQVPTDGPYRFFAELDNSGAQAAFTLESPDPAGLIKNPVLQYTATKDNDEASQFVELKGGVPYHWSADFHNLGPKGAGLLVQGESLPRGPLSQITLYPQTAVEGFLRARTLLSKVLQIVQTFGFGERELSYMTENAAQFSNFKLSGLPTQASDDSPVKAASLFAQFLTMADYAGLRNGPAGGTDGLIDVFQSAATAPGVLASYYASANQTGGAQASGIAATVDTADPSNNKPGTASCHFEGYLLVPADGSYVFFGELEKSGAQLAFRLDAPRGTAPLANPIVLQHTAAGDGEETHQAVTLKSGVAYHLMADFQNLGGGGASLLVQGATLPKGPLNKLALYPVSQLPPWAVLANLTRRDPQVVADVAAALGTDPHFSNNVGIRRMWDALQLMQMVGIPVAALTDCALIASSAPPAGSPAPDAIAASVKNAVKARCTPQTWRPIAKSVFDKLRRKKRDALVAYLIDHLKLENSEQLFEYFLVDPGMEPVVQTSRIRLALSSVQTFVQRCLLNLESGNAGSPKTDVLPGAIEAVWWDWMKRYRVWQANREIFLFPENWMEPELRLDKTDLFQSLESSLLQGDVTRDLVEDAFLAYLKGLEVRARLDVVAMYLDQDVIHPADRTLHVIGRTYGLPHKYFYRTYSHESWSAWEEVTPDIEGNHIVVVLWRGRVNLFWVTFIPTGEPPSSSSVDLTDSTPAASLSFGQLAGKIFQNTAQPQVQVQLHWAEYFQGKWSDRISTDIKRYATIGVSRVFDPDSDFHIHVSKEKDADGNEGAVKIHLDRIADTGYAFRVTSKNCQPDFGLQYAEPAPEVPYRTSGIDATLYTGSASLDAMFNTHIGAGGSSQEKTEHILQSVNNFALLTCANRVTPLLTDSTEPLYQEAGALVSPFFFKDTSHPGTQNELTFFVQPSLTEVTMSQYEGWAISPSLPDLGVFSPSVDIPIIAQVPNVGPVDPGDPVFSINQIQPRLDWVTDPGTTISFGDVSIGAEGSVRGPMAVSRGISGMGGIPGVSPTGTVLAGRGSTFVGNQGLNLGQLRDITNRLEAGAASNVLAAAKTFTR